MLTSCLLGTVAADTTPFRIGVFPRLNQDKTLRQFQPLAEWLGRHLGREVVLESAPDFAAFWERVKAERYALIHYNQYHYIRAHREFGHRVILKNEELGRSQIRATFLVPADSHIRNIAQLRGMKILFGGGKGAMVTHILARDLLRAGGGCTRATTWRVLRARQSTR
ncbi:phosphate/phosphite/phosphonate ABC transporter substrate-binding protein [endosymbiont of unidentified scaly snail isolate Monju]|uniref:phosphate/phosphite/phosphonate ABC transporter substrate-binding protein n=1 Tax=endosymbiont of unidentified scaly snail isolate Monju TaxID=1248727 RepID=UPI0005BD3433|nr:PhnD/SsuA/transferrin family substrate-binding protein [endosymbiont of unidentified scaly snail isolate Monju]